MRKKLSELGVKRRFLTGRIAGGEIFFICRAAKIGRGGAKSGGNDEKLFVIGLGFSGLPVLADGRGAANAAGNGGMGYAGFPDEALKSVINKQNTHLVFVYRVESDKNAK